MCKDEYAATNLGPSIGLLSYTYFCHVDSPLKRILHHLMICDLFKHVSLPSKKLFSHFKHCKFSS